MKKTKNILLTLTTFILIFCIYVTPTYAHTYKKYIEAEKSYEKFETKNKNKWQHALMCDFTHNGIPELITYKESGVRFQIDLYAYKKHKIVKLNKEKIYGVIDVGYCVKDKKIYVMQTSSAFDVWIQEYKIKNNKLVKVNRYKALTNPDTNKTKYYKNNKTIKKKQYTKYLKKIEWITPKCCTPTKR